MKFQKLTPNLLVRNVAASMDFYAKTLGFQRAITVPEQAPHVFGSVTNGAVEIFFNDQKAESRNELQKDPGCPNLVALLAAGWES